MFLGQSEEILILKKQRQKEFSGMRPAKLREESSILKNIQRREMVDKVLNFSKVRNTANDQVFFFFFSSLTVLIKFVLTKATKIGNDFFK